MSCSCSLHRNVDYLADKFGYGFRSGKVVDEVRYYLTPAIQEAA